MSLQNNQKFQEVSKVRMRKVMELEEGFAFLVLVLWVEVYLVYILGFLTNTRQEPKK